MQVTPRMVAFIGRFEGLVLEPYLDSGDVLTWGLGVTMASGHDIHQYAGKPSTVERAIEVATDLMQRRYMPDVEAAFRGRRMTEGQVAAALSFHWNTGAILRTKWVPLFMQGDMPAAEHFLRHHYANLPALADRRAAEADLFFHGKWPANMRIPVYGVNTVTRHPIFAHATWADIKEA
jgi:GH24 family phage-related lysozyme (muramidase)